MKLKVKILWLVSAVLILLSMQALANQSNSEAISISKIKNQWDRDVALKIGMGLDKEAFTLGNLLLASKTL